jgi:type VI protein secretion system component VasK
MNPYSWLQLILYFAVLMAAAWPLGVFMARFQGEHTFMDPIPARRKGHLSPFGRQA